MNCIAMSCGKDATDLFFCFLSTGPQLHCWVVIDEESAFWLMDCLINDLLPGRSTSVKFLIKGIP